MSISVVVTSASGGAEDDGVDALSPLSFFGTFSSNPAREAVLLTLFPPDDRLSSSSSGLRLRLRSCFFRLSLSLFLSLSRGDLSLFLSFLLGDSERELERFLIGAGGGEPFAAFLSDGGGDEDPPRRFGGGGDFETDFFPEAPAGDGLLRPCLFGFFRSRLRDRERRSRDLLRSRPPPPPPPVFPRR